MAQWTDASRTTLINEFQNRPILWDRRMNDVNARTSKQEALVKVTQILNDTFWPSVTKQQYTVDDVKQQWKNLKDTFVRKQRWVNEGKYQRDPQEAPSWKFYKLLKFLDNSPEDICSPASPQGAGNSNDGTSRDVPSAASSLSLPPSTSSISTPDLELLSNAALQHQHNQHAIVAAAAAHHHHQQQQMLSSLPTSISGMDIKSDFMGVGDLGRLSNSDMMSLLSQHLRHHPAAGKPQMPQVSPRSLSQHLMASTPVKMQADLEDTDTTTSPSSSRGGEQSNDSTSLSMCKLTLPSSLPTKLDLDALQQRPLTTFPTSFDSPAFQTSSLSRVVNSCPNMSVEHALRLSGGAGLSCDPPPKKRKTYEARMASLISSASSLPSPSPTHLSTSLLPPNALQQQLQFQQPQPLLSTGSPRLDYRTADSNIATPPALAELTSSSRLGGIPMQIQPNLVDCDDWTLYGAYVAATLRRLTTDAPAEGLHLQKSINDLLFDVKMRVQGGAQPRPE